MTLKEKFDETLTYLESKRKVSECSKIADDFAIGFAEWLVTDWHNDERWSIINDRKELLEIYKKEKGL
jgi:hypothetical protein